MQSYNFIGKNPFKRAILGQNKGASIIACHVGGNLSHGTLLCLQYLFQRITSLQPSCRF